MMIYFKTSLGNIGDSIGWARDYDVSRSCIVKHPHTGQELFHSFCGLIVVMVFSHISSSLLRLNYIGGKGQ